MKKAFWSGAAACLLALLLLSACRPEPERSSGGTSAGSPVETVKTAQELLAEQKRDEYHDAFLVDTGGALGTLLVTAEREEQEDAYDWQIRFCVWDPRNMETPVQTLSAEECSVFHHSMVVDANFDGHQDFGYMYFMGNQPTYYNFWLWEEQTGRFVEEPALRDVCSPAFDGETQTVSGYLRMSGASNGATSFYCWRDGQLTCIRRILVDFSGEVWDSPFLLTVQDDTDGALTEVYRAQFPWDGPEWSTEVEKWCDLSYHGDS